MSEHLSTEIIERYRRNELCGKPRFDAAKHIAECKQCRSQAGGAEVLRLAYAAFSSSLEEIAKLPVEHLSGEQVADFVSGKLNEVQSEIVVSHLAWCELCADDVEDIRLYARQIVLDEKKKSTTGAEWRKRVFGLWKEASRPVFVGAGSVAVLMLAAILWRYGTFDKAGEIAAPTTATKISSPNANPPISQTPPTTSSPEITIKQTETLRPSQANAAELAWALPVDRRLLNAAWSGGKIEVRKEIAEMWAPRGKMGNSEGASFDLVAPTGTMIRESKPTLKWQPLENVVKYKVQLVDKTSGKNFPASFVEGTEWTPDSELERGHRYFWHVIVTPERGKVVYGRWANRTYGDFIVLSAEQLKQVEAAESHYRASKDSLAHIALAVRYADAGLIGDAKQELESYLKQKPDSSQARKMLESLPRVGGK